MTSTALYTGTSSGRATPCASPGPPPLLRRTANFCARAALLVLGPRILAHLCAGFQFCTHHPFVRATSLWSSGPGPPAYFAPGSLEYLYGRTTTLCERRLYLGRFGPWSLHGDQRITREPALERCLEEVVGTRIPVQIRAQSAFMHFGAGVGEPDPRVVRLAQRALRPHWGKHIHILAAVVAGLLYPREFFFLRNPALPGWARAFARLEARAALSFIVFLDLSALESFVNIYI